MAATGLEMASAQKRLLSDIDVLTSIHLLPDGVALTTDDILTVSWHLSRVSYKLWA